MVAVSLKKAQGVDAAARAMRRVTDTSRAHSAAFFQAEDGIRDVERSRGLGDVYKRQCLFINFYTDFLTMTILSAIFGVFGNVYFGLFPASVSYTHLTLPTICSV